MIFSDTAYDHYLQQLLASQEILGSQHLAHWLNGDMQNLMKSNELNLTTAIDLFDWVDISLDDVERLSV
ncbi:MAG: hypothetical protein WGN25_12790 [Candidatus Electrothrix sp. GW3-4]|uniref:hypothetical protein n=1 Tax=Candidatus Electrothrix sp. GW3-4 TaxID=3126740 RepID=UPI0030CC1FAB